MREEGETHVGEVVLRGARGESARESRESEYWSREDVLKSPHVCRVWGVCGEDVCEERTWLEKRTCSRGARHERNEERTLLERRKADELWVDAQQGSRDSFPVFFSFGFMCKCLWEAPVGDIVELYKCCRVPCSRLYFYTALSFVCL